MVTKIDSLEREMLRLKELDKQPNKQEENKNLGTTEVEQKMDTDLANLNFKTLFKNVDERTLNDSSLVHQFNTSDWNKWLDRDSNKIIPINEEEDYEGGQFDISNLAGRYKLDEGKDSVIKKFKSKLD